MTEVQSLILNSSYPKDLEEVLRIQKENTKFDVESLVDSIRNDNNVIYEWSVSKWIKPDDIVFFMHSKNSIHTIGRLRNQLKNAGDQFDEDEKQLIQNGLELGKEIYRQFGGKIYALGRVSEKPKYVDPEEIDHASHWKSRIYAYVDDCVLLEHPIALSEFDTFIKLSCGGSITPVYGKEFEMLKATIKSKNSLPEYFENSMAMSIPLSEMNDENWIEIASRYRHQFLYESQFRTFYVDRLLRFLGDKKSFSKECACKKAGQKTSFIDNVILFGGYYLPVEIKLSIASEQNLFRQVEKYCDLTELYLDKDKKKKAPLDRTYNNWVLVIDTYGVYLYSSKEHNMKKLLDLDDIKSRGDIFSFREKLLALLGRWSREDQKDT